MRIILKVGGAILSAIITAVSLGFTAFNIKPDISWALIAFISFLFFVVIVGWGWYEAAQKQYEETSHKKKMREIAGGLTNKIRLPLIKDCFIAELKPETIYIRNAYNEDMCPPIRIAEQRKIEIELINQEELFQRALLMHLKTGGFSKALSDIKLWQRGAADNLLKCHDLLNLVMKELEQEYNTSIPTQDLGQAGFTIDFPITVCADAVEKARDSDHFTNFPYTYSDSNLK